MFRLRDSLEVIGLKLWVDYACWLYCDVFPRWRGAVCAQEVGIRRVHRVLSRIWRLGAQLVSGWQVKSRQSAARQ